MKRIFVYVNGCELRRIDANKIYRYLSENKHILVNNPKDADIIILVTCAYLNRMAESSLIKVKEFQKYDAELIVAGCLPEIETERLSEIFDGKTVSTKNINEIDSLFPENKIKYSQIEDKNSLYYYWTESINVISLKNFFRKIRFIEHPYALIKNYVLQKLCGGHSIVYAFLAGKNFFIRISGGCLGNCSYCSIKKAIGQLKSKPVEECIKELRKGLNKGYKDFVITADDIGCYGLDIGSNLPELLSKITKIPGKYELLIRGLCPRWIIKYIDDFEKILKYEKIMRIDVPIQSGNSRVLKLMNRYSDTDKMKDAFLRLKKAYPEISLFVHFIAGFPTETEDEFRQTLSFIREINFDSGALFPFSCKTGTEAEKIEPKVPKEEIDKRLKYAKKFLKKAGYRIRYQPKMHFFVFEKNNI